MGRRGGHKRCPLDGKTSFRRRKDAVKRAHRLPDNDNRVYWCPAAGGYHLTRSSTSEYSRRQAAKRHEGEDADVEPDQEPQDQPKTIGRGGDCPTCGWLHGFHDPVLHSYHNVPVWLTWRPDQPAPWERTNNSIPRFDPLARQKQMQ